MRLSTSIVESFTVDDDLLKHDYYFVVLSSPDQNQLKITHITKDFGKYPTDIIREYNGIRYLIPESVYSVVENFVCMRITNLTLFNSNNHSYQGLLEIY